MKINKLTCMTILTMSILMSLASVALSQQFPPSGYITIHHMDMDKDTGMCLEVIGGSLSKGDTVGLRPCTGLPEQLWKFINPYAGTHQDRHGHRQLLNKNSELCLNATSLLYSYSTTQEACLNPHIHQSALIDHQLFKPEYIATIAEGDVTRITGRYGRDCLHGTPGGFVELRKTGADSCQKTETNYKAKWLLIEE